MEHPPAVPRHPTVWLKPGLLIVFGAALEAKSHKHHAIQVVWPADQKAICRHDDLVVHGAVIVQSRVAHQLTMDSGWVMLVEPQSALGARLSQMLGNQVMLTLQELPTTSPLIPRTEDDPATHLGGLFGALGMKQEFLAQSTGNTASTVADERLRTLLRELDECLFGACLKPAGWRAAEVARSLSLSEGRFLHLFREQMHIPWRPYLLWRRLNCAVNGMAQGASATEAAHGAGFSDSAHLSRTFKSLFGLSIREAGRLFS
jgi:AraC-like DNA-binding protein